MMMKFLLLVGLVGLASASRQQVTPVQKVIQMIKGMAEKGKADKADEQTQFSAYKQFCDDTATEKKRTIGEAEEKMDMLTADIQKYTSDAEQLGTEIAALDAELSVIAGDMNAATKVREMEHQAFVAAQQDTQESITQVGIATDEVKAQAHDVAQSAALLQKLPNLDTNLKNMINTFLAHDKDPEDVDAENLAMGTPQANAAEFQSGGIIDLFKKINGDFDEKLAELQKKELQDKNSFDLLMADLTTSKNTATASHQEKSEARSKALEDAAEAKSSLADTTAVRDSDAKYLADLEATCAQKASDFESRQTLRAGEIQALESACEILEGNAVSGAAAAHLPALAQIKSKAFVQLRSVSNNPNQLRVAAYLKDAGDRIHSKVLAALSVRVAYDPFKSVKKMIKDMVVKLMEEAAEEQEHKGWCDNELATNEQTRKEKTQAVEVLHAEIDELEASIAQLSNEITQLNTAIADSDKAVQEATAMREKEKAKNTKVIADANAASEAVANAMSVLQEFYAKAGTATALVQTKTLAGQPAVFDEAYTGMQSESGGVIGMIEVIQSDFARLESETTTSEAEAAKEYDDFMSDSAVDKASKTTDVEHKSAKKQNSEQALVEKKDDLAGTQEELDSALTYFEKLKPDCVDAGVSYEDRVARRKEEIASLQEALKILNGEDIAGFLQQN